MLLSLACVYRKMTWTLHWVSMARDLKPSKKTISVSYRKWVELHELGQWKTQFTEEEAFFQKSWVLAMLTLCFCFSRVNQEAVANLVNSEQKKSC